MPTVSHMQKAQKFVEIVSGAERNTRLMQLAIDTELSANAQLQELRGLAPDLVRLFTDKLTQSIPECLAIMQDELVAVYLCNLTEAQLEVLLEMVAQPEYQAYLELTADAAFKSSQTMRKFLEKRLGESLAEAFDKTVGADFETFRALLDGTLSGGVFEGPQKGGASNMAPAEDTAELRRTFNSEVSRDGVKVAPNYGDLLLTPEQFGLVGSKTKVRSESEDLPEEKSSDIGEVYNSLRNAASNLNRAAEGLLSLCRNR